MVNRAGWCVVGFNVLVLVVSSKVLAEQAAKSIAPTVADATQVFDPATFPTMKTEEPIAQKYVGGFSYQTESDPKTAYEFHQKALVKLKWKELPNSYVSDMFSSGTFSKEGYMLSLSVIAQNDGKNVLVTLQNHSNIPLDKLPTPKGVKPFFSVPGSQAYITTVGRDETATAVTQLLEAQGWEPYGTAGDQLFFKQNAVQLSANVATAPAQNNQTVITYSAEQLSADIPVPKKTIGLQYSDSTKTVFYDVDADLPTIHKFYNDTLGKTGWKPTLDKPILIGFRETVIYRNPEKELLELRMFTFEGKLRVELQHQSAQEVAEIDARVKAEIEAKKKKAATKPKLEPVAIALPASAKNVKAEASQMEFTLETGKAKPFVESLRKAWKKADWKETSATVEDLFGLILLEKGDLKLQISYEETGILPSEVSISGEGVELQQAKEKPSP